MKPIELSFEFFPPKTAEGVEKLRATRAQLLPLKPKFVSVTFGAGGSTQQGTLDTVLDMQKDGLEAAPHLSCIGSSRADLRAILDQYRSHGIRHIVALRGDLPSGMGAVGELRYASELVSFIRAEHGDWFHIEVAGYPEYHPQARSPKADLENFARKVKAGANSAITQYFFNADAYFRFVDDARKLGVDVPIVPGIMPITNVRQLERMTSTCGASVPSRLRRELVSRSDQPDAVGDFGVAYATMQCAELLRGGAPGIHFYTLNRSPAT
ncbi:MAG: methylenetetrahydrofolate reductase [NAD(P)H], partial [Burkholderia ambifaria]